MTDQKHGLYCRAIDTYGSAAQVYKALEELGEAIQAIARLESAVRRRTADPALFDHAAEEIADARIMLEQLCMIYDIETEAEGWKWKKLTRLKERLDQREGLSPQAQPEGQDAGETRGPLCVDAGRKERLDQHQQEGSGHE